MIDIHSHLIPGVDDGSRSIDTTIEAIREAAQAGFTDIILTSHFMTDYYETDKDELVFWKEKLQEILDAKKINLKLHSGMEVYITNQLGELFNEKRLLTLADSNYILIELPMNTTINYLDYVIYFLDSVGLKFVLAHPERYKAVQNNPNIVKEYIQKGCLIQCNFGSLLGMYGSGAKKTLKHLLKDDLVDFMASDCHNKGGIYLDIPKAVSKLEKMIGIEKTKQITELNQKKILNKQDW